MNRSNFIESILQAVGKKGGNDAARQAALDAMRSNIVRDMPSIRSGLVDNKGFTYDPIVGSFVVPRAVDPTSAARGYAVSVNPRESEILLGSPGNISEAELMKAYDDLVASGTLSPGVNFGGFLSDESNQYAMDPSRLIQGRRPAMRSARRLGQEGVFDMSAPDFGAASINTSDLRREFRGNDARTAAAVAALAALLGLSGDRGNQ
jgi:hypothetical protein